MGASNKKYAGAELEMIKENLDKPVKVIHKMINEVYGNNRSLRGLKKFISEKLGGKTPCPALKRPVGSIRVTRGRRFIKTENGWVKEDRLIAGAKDGECITYDQNGHPIAISKGEHLRLNKMKYRSAEKELKKSMLLIAKVQQKACELMK